MLYEASGHDKVRDLGIGDRRHGLPFVGREGRWRKEKKRKKGEKREKGKKEKERKRRRKKEKRKEMREDGKKTNNRLLRGL